MTLTAIIIVNTVLDLGVLAALAAAMGSPFRRDRRAPAVAVAPVVEELLEVAA